MNIDWQLHLTKALERRQTLMQSCAEKTNCFRLFNGNKEGLSGLVIEQFSDVVIFQVFEKECLLNDQQLKSMGDWIVSNLNVRSVYKKVFVKDRSQQAAGDQYYAPEPLSGVSSNPEIVVKENGLQYEIHPFSGYSTGLFLDQRDNRMFLSKNKAGKQVLNLFAYTCGFSLACAAEGAKTTSVDLSKKYLDWGKRNFEHNKLDLSSHQFVARDAFDFLKQAQKKGQGYHSVIVDPPSFSRTKEGRAFSLKKDYARLLQALAPVVVSGGELFFSCNLSDWDSAFIQSEAKLILEELGRWDWKNTPPRPQDFETVTTPLSQWLAVKL